MPRFVRRPAKVASAPRVSPMQARLQKQQEALAAATRKSMNVFDRHEALRAQAHESLRKKAIAIGADPRRTPGHAAPAQESEDKAPEVTPEPEVAPEATTPVLAHETREG
jgi:hypothetical protein